MAEVNTNLNKKIVAALLADADVIALLAQDTNDNYSISPEFFIPTGAVTPILTVGIVDNESEAIFPASYHDIRITVYVDPKIKKEPRSFLNTISDYIITLFNKKGNTLNEIDIDTDTGIRVCKILKTLRNFDIDERLGYNYVEVLFESVISEGESFSEASAGDKAWV